LEEEKSPNVMGSISK